LETLIEALEEKIPHLSSILESTNTGIPHANQVSDVPFVPLGQQRLHTVELVLNIVRLK
jgi:hypothetical protein